MFSANENIQLRQAKKNVVAMIEATIPPLVLDEGVNVMVMQVACNQQGCVPLETAIVIIFPDCGRELLPHLPASHGGTFKTKILKPLSAVTKDDILDALPGAFLGGRRTMESLCLKTRDGLLAQMAQLFDDDDREGRRLMAQYLQQSLQEYIDRDCVAPPWGESYEDESIGRSVSTSINPLPTSGNIVIRRKLDDEEEAQVSTSGSSSGLPTEAAGRVVESRASPSSATISVNSVQRRRQQQAVSAQLAGINSHSILTRLSEREHAPGVRQPGCPCCDPDHPSNIVDRMMLL